MTPSAVCVRARASRRHVRRGESRARRAAGGIGRGRSRPGLSERPCSTTRAGVARGLCDHGALDRRRRSGSRSCPGVGRRASTADETGPANELHGRCRLVAADVDGDEAGAGRASALTGLRRPRRGLPAPGRRRARRRPPSSSGARARRSSGRPGRSTIFGLAAVAGRCAVVADVRLRRRRDGWSAAVRAAEGARADDHQERERGDERDEGDQPGARDSAGCRRRWYSQISYRQRTD